MLPRSLTFINGRLVNGQLTSAQQAAAVSIHDRGLNYGDGVFETMRATGAKIPYRQWHFERLQQGCARLRIAVATGDIERQLQQAVAEWQASSSDGDRSQHYSVKMVVTRGVGERGYRPSAGCAPTVIVTLATLPPPLLSDGVEVTLCRHRLAISPALAGIKHLNRLDNVLAGMELENTHFSEGLLFDRNDKLIEATSRNVFLAVDGQLHTPRLSEAGVQGVMRRLIMEKYAPRLGIEVKEATLVERDLYRADEVILCNSVSGIWPVTKIDEHTLAVGPIARALQQSWWNDVAEHGV